jgi:hypothetical protein
MQRPTGVTILAVLAAIGGILGIIGAFGLFALGALGGALGAVGAGAAVGFLVGGFAIFWGLVTLVMGVVDLGFAYGAWFLKPWAWMVGIGVEALAVIVAFVNLIGGNSDFFGFLLSVVIAGAIIYYLFTPEVKRVFGRP